jgi:phosphoenolpyruvate carboxylase
MTRTVAVVSGLSDAQSLSRKTNSDNSENKEERIKRMRVFLSRR